MHDKIDRDAFDTLSEKEPEKFLKLQNSLVQFVNGHLDKLNLSGLSKKALKLWYLFKCSADNMETSFSDGCYLIMLIGQLDGYFVPHYSYYIPGMNKKTCLYSIGNFKRIPMKRN